MAVLLVGPLLASAGHAPDASAASAITITATADAQVKADYPSKNYGTTGDLRARTSHRSFMAFQLPTFAGAPTSAVLRLYVTDASPDGASIHRVTGAWRESTVSWASAPSFTSTPITRLTASSATNRWVETVVPANALTSGGRLDVALVSASSNSVVYTSRESATPPQLVLTFAVPPATASPTARPTLSATPSAAPTASPRPSTTPSATPTPAPATLAPSPTLVPTITPVPTLTPVPTQTPAPTGTPAPTAVPTSTPVLPAAADAGLIIDRAELMALPMSGTAWLNLKKAADASPGTADIQDQDSGHDIAILAKGLVYARTGDVTYRTAVLAGLKAAVGTETGGRTLALARNLPGYAIAADLIDLRSVDPAFDTGTFRPWLRSLLTKSLDGRTLVSTHEDRPNNWGTHAGAARAAIAAYLGDSVELTRTATVFRAWVGDRSAYAGFEYGDVSWQADASKPVGINPRGATKNGVVIDGAIPDDMRRGAAFHWPATFTDYPWEAMQGAVLQALILDQAGYPAFAWGDQALRRASDFLYDQTHWLPDGDDTWQPWILNHAYGTARPVTAAHSGKNFGFSDWLFPG